MSNKHQQQKPAAQPEPKPLPSTAATVIDEVAFDRPMEPLGHSYRVERAKGNLITPTELGFRIFKLTKESTKYICTVPYTRVAHVIERV